MAIVASTVTVNAAFLQEIKEDNRELSQLLKRAEAECESAASAPASAASMAELLVQVRDQLAFHFALEEAYGYFEHAVDTAPRLGQRAQALRSEHETLFREVCSIVDAAEEARMSRYGRRNGDAMRIAGEDRLAGEDCVGKVARRFLEFCRKLKQHEAEETELILQALDDDIGVGD